MKWFEKSLHRGHTWSQYTPLRNVSDKKLWNRRRTARRDVSVKILSAVETICTTSPQRIAAVEIEGYSWSTCSKQPRLIDCRIGVVNKLDCRRVLLTTLLTCRGEIFKVQSWGQSSGGQVPNFWRYPHFLKAQCRIDAKNQLDSSSRFDTILACDRQTDGQTITQRQHIPR